MPKTWTLIAESDDGTLVEETVRDWHVLLTDAYRVDRVATYETTGTVVLTLKRTENET